MMRLLGVGPIDIISTTIMTTTLNGSLPASSDCIAPSQPLIFGSEGRGIEGTDFWDKKTQIGILKPREK